MGLMKDVGVGPVAIDTAAFIYYIEEHPVFSTVVQPLFEAIGLGKIRAITSGLTLLEVLVVPFRCGDMPLAERYEALLTRSRGLDIVDIDRNLLRAAAQVRAAHPAVRTPDAIQISAALSKQCPVLVTNDRDLPSVPGLKVLKLTNYVRKKG